MIERAIVKLNGVIEILQKEIDYKENKKLSKKKNMKIKDWEIKQGDESDSGSSNSEVSGQSHIDQNKRQVLSSKSEKQYEPFKRYKKDLKLLLTF